MRLRRNSLFILFCCFWFAAIAQAATLTVQLKDPSGAAVASALVAVGQEAKQPVNLPGDGKGNYRISTMSAGNYQLSIVADGFKPIQKSIAVVEPETTLPISLELAEVETAVDVDTDLSKLANSDPAYVALRKDPLTETWEVSNFKFFRENAEITLTGKVSFAAPVLGKTVTAIFEGEGMFALTPVTLSEKAYIEDRFGPSPVTEDFRAAILYFTDTFQEKLVKSASKAPLSPSAAAVLKEFRSRLHHRPQPARSLAESIVHSNESGNAEAKLLAEIYHGSPTHSSFRLYMKGRKHGDLRFILDTRGALPDLPSPEEVALVNVDPTGTKDGLWYMTHLVSEHQKGTANQEENKRPFQALHYKIDTAVARGGKLSAVTEITLQAREAGPRVVFLDLLPNLRTSRVSVGDQDLAFIQESRSVDGAFAVILPKALAKDEKVTVKVEYSGNKILEDQGGGNFSVAARTSWYPNVNTFLDRATYELTFRVPKGLTLVSVGKLKREWKEGEYAGSEWESKVPLAIAGFNYGLFKRKAITDTDTNYLVEAYATSELPAYMREVRGAESMTPSAMAQSAIVDSQNSMRLFTNYFGPIAYGRIAITQQPQFSFGQSWPTLIYLPISAFLDSTQRYMLLGARTFKFTEFIDEVTPHEVAHQWWGHAVGWASYRDQWISEGFAEFSASLYVENLDKKGDRTRQFWERLRKQIVEKNEYGNSAVSAGSVNLGLRLDSEKHPAAYRKMVYPKGAFIVHMLRQLMWDSKTGDADFFAMMKDFVKTYTDKNASTEGFFQIVQKHMKASMNVGADGSILWFYNQFVLGSELPKYKLTYEVKPSEDDQFKAVVQVEQSNVSEKFVSSVPLYVELEGRQLRVGSIKLTGNSKSGPIPVSLPKKPSKILVNAKHDVLTADGPA